MRYFPFFICFCLYIFLCRTKYIYRAKHIIITWNPWQGLLFVYFIVYNIRWSLLVYIYFGYISPLSKTLWFNGDCSAKWKQVVVWYGKTALKLEAYIIHNYIDIHTYVYIRTYVHMHSFSTFQKALCSALYDAVCLSIDMKWSILSYILIWNMCSAYSYNMK